MAPADSIDVPRGNGAHGGFLVEALVAVAVLAIGVLGTVALLASSLRAVHAAESRHDAIALAYALVGRMRAENPATLASRYATSGDAWTEFAGLARRLPGAALAGNEPGLTVDAGPTGDSRRVSVVVHWQMPGERRVHSDRIDAVVGAR
jgi:type IV pilus assembly protein PilV